MLKKTARQMVKAAREGNIKKLTELLNAGADPNKKDTDGAAALTEAAWRGSPEWPTACRWTEDRGCWTTSGSW